MTNSETAGAGAAPDRPTKQPEALRLADALERPGYGWHSTPAQCAAELRRLHVENTTLQAGYAAARLEIESLRARSLPEIKDMHNGPQQLNLSDRAMWVLGWNECRDAARDADRAMRAAQPATADDRAAFKAYLEDCDECAIVPDIAGAFHAGWTSRVRAAQPVGAQQPGSAYAAQDSEHQRAIMEAERNASLDAYSRVVYLSGAESRLYEAGFTNGWQRASHGQAPAGESLRTDALCDLSYSHGLKAGWNYCASDDLAGFERAQKIGAEALRTLKSPTAQAAPAYKDSTPELHVGDSAFESWYSTYSPVHKSDKQRARDAYAAGMGDPLVTAASAAVAGPHVTDAMALAFHSALSDGAIGSDEVEEIKAGLRAALDAAQEGK